MPGWAAKFSGVLVPGVRAVGKGLRLSMPGFTKEFSGVLYARKSGTRKRPGIKRAWLDQKNFRRTFCQEFRLLGLSTTGFFKEFSGVLYARKSGSGRGPGAKRA